MALLRPAADSPVYGRAMRSKIAIAALLMLALAPPVALGSTASVSIKRVFYAADPGEVNQLTVSSAGADFALSDPGATIQPGAGCTGGSHDVVCSGAGIIGLTLAGGDGGDSLANQTSMRSTLSGGDGSDSLKGGSGDDTLRGNQGVDTISAGAGDDFVDVRGDRADIVTCGPGVDTVRGDGSDLIDSDCEQVDRGGSPAPPPSGPGPTPAAGGLLGPTETARLAPGACANDRLGSAAADRLVGTRMGDNLYGLQGDDVLAGRARDDCLFGGVGSDALAGDRGDDRLLGDDPGNGVPGRDRLSGGVGNDLLDGGPGADRLRGGRGNDRLVAGGGRNVLLGGPGNDRLSAANGKRDRVNCGRGSDRARVDASDRVSGCEHVRRISRG
jgi:Ca2+-binding RTX toxin-like protein